jgi:catalase
MNQLLEQTHALLGDAAKADNFGKLVGLAYTFCWIGDHRQQPGDLFRNMTSAQKQTLFDNTARQVGQASKHIQERHVANCAKADPAYGKGVVAAGKL